MQLFEYVLEPAERKKYVSLSRWFVTILNQSQVKAVVKDYKLCEKAAVFDPAKYAAFQQSQGGAAGAPAADSKKDAKKEKAPKAEKKPEKKEAEPAEELDATEMALRGEPESKDPFQVKIAFS